MIPSLNIKDYSYPLTDEIIAKYPLAERDQSKLLIYKDGEISENVFKNAPQFLPDKAIMVFNETKVVPARLHFRRQSGAHIEIFCLQPVEPAEYSEAFTAVGHCRWQCVIGNSKRWKDDLLSYYVPDGVESGQMEALNLRAALVSRDGTTGVVEFTWDGDVPFSNVLDICGSIPIPPYLNRATEAVDIERYQTVYAHIRGSVAAPTAGLHFSEAVLGDIKDKGIDIENVCLHVGAGTFLPVKTDDVAQHPMHREPFSVNIELLRRLVEGKCPVIAVGTTSVRTLESLYYVGVSIIETGEPQDVSQWAPYERDYQYSTVQALQAIIDYLEAKGLKEIKVGTKIIIVPTFKFRLVDMLFTNFHQSESTLILLVAAFVGEDWRRIYDYALHHSFRFLSYGDSSLLFRSLR